MMLKPITSPFVFLTTLLVLFLPFSCKQAKNPVRDTEADKRFEYFIQQSKAFDRVYAFDTALLYSDSAFRHSLHQKDTKDMAKALLRKGVVYQNKDQLDSSEIILLRAIVLCQENGDSLRLALTLNSIGNTTKAMGKFDEALGFYMRAETIYEQMGDYRRQTYVLLNIGNVYYVIKDFEKALALYKKCKTVSLEAENQEMIKVSIFNMANIYSALKQYIPAEKAYLEVIKMDQQLHDEASLALYYNNLGSVYLDNLKQELGFKYLNKALKLAIKIKDTDIEITSCNLLANYYVDNGDPDQAERFYEKSITLAKEMNNIGSLKTAYHNMANLTEDQSEYDQSLVYYKLYALLHDSLINEKKLEIIYELESKYEKKNDEAEILHLSNVNALQELHNSDLKIQLATFFIIVVLLVGFLFFIGLKNKKDKIIVAQKISQLEEEQKLMAVQSVLVGQENERKRIAQELHDGIGILLSTASIHFSNVEEKSVDEKTTHLLSKANKLLKQAGSEVRKISHDIMPGVLSKFGLMEAIEDLFENVADAGHVKVDCQIDMGEERLSNKMEIMVYRIVQEILNNTLKHANAKHISFVLEKETNELKIKYKEDGIGFEQSKINSEKSLGLSGIKSRIDFLNGQMKLDSGSGKGTQYIIHIPLT